MFSGAEIGDRLGSAPYGAGEVLNLRSINITSLWDDGAAHRPLATVLRSAPGVK
jgi:hypothetical protein